ncbi:MAG TPA: YciI family protein [Gaiella sp.]
MKYALLVYADQAGWSELSEEEATRQRAESMPAWLALFEEMQTADPNVEGKELAAATEAKVVRVRSGERIVTDGPFADTKEVIGGLFLCELPDLDEAIRIASLVPTAGYGSLEIRPIVDHSGDSA